MKNPDDISIYQYFDDIKEPAPEEAFVEDVSRHIKKHKQVQQLKISMLLLGVLTLFAFLTPWIVDYSVFLANMVIPFADSFHGSVIMLAVLIPIFALLKFRAGEL